ncbi:hypothetical protein ILUMI_01959 [Ignelater luminosus]|uniref:Uncharacterized protein n=1 Tax=Ignelater luminosus TaxID=2038154 RepID=A0A8K0DHA7_IGNLU|nr:hypothetical protein ILUMI_01959 [Ignelater luminosus]
MNKIAYIALAELPGLLWCPERVSVVAGGCGGCVAHRLMLSVDVECVGLAHECYNAKKVVGVIDPVVHYYSSPPPSFSEFSHDIWNFPDDNSDIDPSYDPVEDSSSALFDENNIAIKKSEKGTNEIVVNVLENIVKGFQLVAYQTNKPLLPAANERRLRETSRFAPVTADHGHERMIRTPVVEEEILERVAENSTLSTRRLNFQVGVSKNKREATKNEGKHRAPKTQQLFKTQQIGAAPQKTVEMLLVEHNSIKELTVEIEEVRVTTMETLKYLGAWVDRN